MADIQTMNKAEYIKFRADKNKIAVEEIEKLWTEFNDDAVAFGIAPAQLLDFIKQRFAQYFGRKAKRSMNTEKMKIIVIGQQLNSYGAEKHYTAAMQVIKDKEGKLKPQNIIDAAISNGIINDKMQPLYHIPGKNTNKHGEICDLDTAFQYNIQVLAKKIEGDTNWRRGNISCTRKDLKEPLQLFAAYSTELGVGQKSTEDHYILFANDTTIFSKEQELSDAKVDAVFGEYFKDVFFSVSQLEEAFNNYPKPTQGNYDKFVVVRANVADINLTAEGKSNTVTLVDPYNEDSAALVWLPEMIPVNFDYKAQNVLVYGTLAWDTKQNQATINAFSIYIPTKFRTELQERPKPINKNVKVEQQEVKPAQKAAYTKSTLDDDF